MAGGIILFISDTAGFFGIEGGRTADVRVSDDESALIKLSGDAFSTNGGRPTEPAEITITNNSQVAFDTASTVTITTRDNKFRLRTQKGGSTAQSQLTQDDLIDNGEEFDTGDSFNIEILTASDETDTVTDSFQVEFRAPSETLTVDLLRQISLRFKATGQLVYANDRNTIKVLDTLQSNITNPAERSSIDSIGSIVADITGDSNADIAYIRNKRMELTQISISGNNNLTTVFGPNNSPVAPNIDGTRVAAGDLDVWPNKRVVDSSNTNNNNSNSDNDGDDDQDEDDDDDQDEDDDDDQDEDDDDDQDEDDDDDQDEDDDDNDSGRTRSKYSVSGDVALFADKGKNKIFAAQPATATRNQAVEVLVDTSNIGGAAGAAGVEDIDDDGLAELVYLNSSQQLNFIKQIDTAQFSSPSDWVSSQSNYSKVLKKYRDSDNSSKFGKTVGENNNIAFGKATLGNASVGSNANVGVSAIGEFSAGDNKQIPFVDGSNELAVINHKNQKTNLTENTAAIKKAAIAPVDIDDDDITELFFIGDPGKQALPNADTEDVSLNNSGPICYISNPAGIIDNGESANIELLQVPPDQYSKSEVIGDKKPNGDDNSTPGYIIPDIELGLNAGTVI